MDIYWKESPLTRCTMELMQRFKPKAAGFLTGFLAGFLSACATQPDGYASRPAADSKNPDDLMIIDCLLPGQVKKLGSFTTYLAARRPMKTTATDCEIRGGESGSFERAEYA